MRRLQLLALAVVALALVGGAPRARADADLKCTMTFTLKGWSAFYKTATGSGTVHCANGASLNVKLSAKGGGLTVGKSVESGKGVFSGVNNIDEILGAYVAGQVDAGAVKSAQAQVMTKGEVSVALSGKGRGWELGISFGELKIER